MSIDSFPKAAAESISFFDSSSLESTLDSINYGQRETETLNHI